MSTAEERLWNRLWHELDQIRTKLDTKVNYRAFDEFKQETEEQLKEMREQIDTLNRAAITPDQVSTMIGQGLEKSQARGVTKRERTVRYIVAAASVLTAVVVVATAIFQLST